MPGLAASEPAPYAQAELKPHAPARNAGSPDGLWPMARWERDRDDPVTLEVIAQRVADGDTLKEVCRSRGWPKSFVWRWLCENEDRRSAYDDAMKCWADELAQETVEIADNPDPEAVGRDKLRVDTRLKIASKWDRDRYGERERKDVAVFVGALTKDLEQKASEMLRERLALQLSRREPVVIDAVPAAHAEQVASDV
jgi:hypothetical protein